MSEYASTPPEIDQAVPGMENSERFGRVDGVAYEAGPALTDEQFTAIFYEGGEAAERARAEIVEQFEKMQGNRHG